MLNDERMYYQRSVDYIILDLKGTQ